MHQQQAFLQRRADMVAEFQWRRAGSLNIVGLGKSDVGANTKAKEGGFVAFNPETGTTTQGETYQEAIQNLKQATSLYLEEFPMKIYSHPVMTTFEVGHQNWISKPQI